MLTDITDHQPGEPDILTPVRHSRLVIRDLESNEFFSQNAPKSGWTHEQLTGIQPPGPENGAEAFLDNK